MELDEDYQKMRQICHFYLGCLNYHWVTHLLWIINEQIKIFNEQIKIFNEQIKIFNEQIKIINEQIKVYPSNVDYQ
ncbi:hypothetical protein FRX31_014218 [Thalictrum thalictroides]|uniref:Uncharacterized protein n=1 Tax=Thalictrum thalictroides TaxID=46969 RepID=A0A7J6WID7_THATH|nr:hypothetical protein FRX31_014218 [Thalictrum thalictroides]